MNILITGGTGLVGSHLTERLTKLGHHIVVPYRSIDPRSYFFLQCLDKNVSLISADITDYFRIFDIITRYEIAGIFHLAAQSIVETAFYNPLQTIATNVLGTANILEAARLYPKIKVIIIASSDKAYGKTESIYNEKDALRGDHPYEVSKSSSDLIAQTYYKTYKLPVIITRFGNIFGPGDLNFSRIIPGIIKAIICNQEIIIRSDGKYIRDYIYVDDVVSGYEFLFNNLTKSKGEAFNISSNCSLKVIELINKIESIVKCRVKYRIINSAINEIPVQHLDISKIQKIGWKPASHFEKGIEDTFKWYKRNRKVLFSKLS